MFGREKRDPWNYNSSVPKPLTEFRQPQQTVSDLEALAQIARMPEAAKSHIRAIEVIKNQTMTYAARAEVSPDVQLRALDRLCTNDLPNVVAAWLQLPPRTTLDDGRSADDALIGQLASLHAAATRYEHEALQSGRDSVQIESIYLDEKYGSAGN